MARFVVEQSDLDPAFRKKIRWDITEGIRPTTKDTIENWIKKEELKQGTCLAISSQPHVAYQHSVLRTCLPKAFSLQTAGPAIIDNLSSLDDLKNYNTIQIGVILDALTRLLYQENERLKLEKSK